MEAVVSTEFWKGKRVFLTGHTGFKGAWLSMWLSELGAEVTGYALEPPTAPSLFVVSRVEELLEASAIGDIRDAAGLSQAIIDCRPDVVIHMAAQPLVLNSYDDPLETYQTNVIGTVNLFEAVRKCPTVRVVVNVTTDKCYENKEWVWGYRETEPMGGHDPYSSSKACSELVTSTYQNCFFNDSSSVHVASARAGNVIGGGDWAENRLVPDFLRSIVDGDVLKVRNPNAIRPWQLVLEPLSGYLILAEKLWGDNTRSLTSGWNFGPSDNDAKPVSWIADKLCEKWGGKWELEDSTVHYPHEAGYLKLDCNKARSLLGWKPKYNLDQALGKIIDWQKAYINSEDMQVTCRRQISAFMSVE